jgi:hypothetical protein
MIMPGYAEMRAAVLRWINENAGMDPKDIHWAIPLKLRKDLPEVRDMPGGEDEVLVMVRGLLVGWWLHGPGHGSLPPAARDPRRT